MPASLGQKAIDPAGWTGSELEANRRWIYELDSAELSGMRAMAASIERMIGSDPNGLLTLPREAFDFGKFGTQIDRIRAELKDGLGAVLIRGLPLDEIGPLHAAIIYYGLGRHIGIACSNNPDGDVFGHVTDKGKSQKDPLSRGYQTREELTYHTDQCSVVGLLCVRTPKSGGLSKISSSVALYNEMLERSPRSVEVLSEPFFHTKHGEVDEGQKGYYQSPVFNFLDGMLCTSFGPTHIKKGHDFPDVPDLTEEQIHAIDLAKAIAEELHYAMELQRGDIQLLNNSVVLHNRTAYEDWPEEERKRLLWRLWLVEPGIRPLTPYITEWSEGVKVSSTVERIVL